MEVAPPAFRPRAAEGSRRNGDLIRAGPHDRLKGDRVAADSDPARYVLERRVVERRNGAPSGESILPSKYDSIELAIPLIADSWQAIPICEVAAVPDDEGIGPAIAKAMGCQVHLEVEMQGVAGLERLLQRINAVAEVVIHEHGRRGSVNGYSSGFDSRDGGQMDGVDGRGGNLVSPRTSRRHGSTHPADRDKSRCEGCAGEGWLRDARILSVAPLVPGAPLRLFGRGTVAIERVGVVEDETAQGDDERHRHRGHAGRRTRGTTARHREPRPQTALRAARPQ